MLWSFPSHARLFFFKQKTAYEIWKTTDPNEASDAEYDWIVENYAAELAEIKESILECVRDLSEDELIDESIAILKDRREKEADYA